MPLHSSLSNSHLCLGDAQGKSRNMVFTAPGLEHRELPAWRWAVRSAQEWKSMFVALLLAAGSCILSLLP